jgi:hypothetical protein
MRETSSSIWEKVRFVIGTREDYVAFGKYVLGLTGILLIGSILVAGAVALWQAPEVAKDAGWLPWTVRVSANVSDRWIAGELKDCTFAGTRGEQPALVCADEKPEYHDIAIQFTGRRWTDQEENTLIHRWKCQRHAATLLEAESFTCQGVND